MSDSEHKDILLDLLSCGIPGLVDHILSMLSPADLYRYVIKIKSIEIHVNLV